MAQISKAAIDTELRNRIFADLDISDPALASRVKAFDYVKVNDRQYGCLITDANGVERYCRIGVIVAEEREDMTARELMDSEIQKYKDAQEKKAEKAAKAAADKAAREAAAKEVE